MNNKIYLTDEGLNEYRKEIKILNDKLAEIQKMKSEACSGAVGDGWHDNFAYEDAKRQEDAIVTQIKDLGDKSKYIEIITNDIKDQNIINLNDIKDQNIINLNDILKVEFTYEDGTKDEEIIKLTGNWKSREYDEFQEVTLNSPIGKNIYGKDIKDIIEYSVNEKKIIVKVIEKINEIM